MREKGKVIKIEGLSAEIEIEPKEACSKCCACSGRKDHKVLYTGEKVQGLKVGDTVEVEVEPGSMMRVYALLYGLPLVSFIATLIVVYLIAKSPLFSVACGMLAIVLSYFLSGLCIRKIPELAPRIDVKTSN